MKENITNTIPRISILYTSLGCPIHRLSWTNVHTAGEIHSTDLVKEILTNAIPNTSMHQASRSGISNPQTLMNKQPNNKTWFVYVFPSDIKPRSLTNLPHLRVRFHGYVIIWEMAAETNTQITTTNKQIRNAGEVHSTTIGKKNMNKRIKQA